MDPSSNRAKCREAVAIVSWFAMALLARNASAQDDPRPPAVAPPPKVDLAAREVAIPVRFVNPSRQIEVFACHTRGPTHETVFEFDTSGESIYRALIEIGCRPTDYWNATSPSDFARTQGDRLIVFVRWTHDGKTVELPAEALLDDGDTAFPMFVRGFSFSGYDVAARAKAELEARKQQAIEEGADPDAVDAGVGVEDEIATPIVVEISLGAARRERAVYSILSHPTSLTGRPSVEGAPATRAFQYWSLPPVVSDRTLPNLEELARAGTEATLVLRRVESEVELVRYARSTVSSYGESRRLALYDKIEPLAAEIDRHKSAYEDDVAEIGELLAEDRDRYFGDSFRDLENRGEMLRRRGQWLSARIQELYFGIYAIEEAFKAEVVNGSDIDPEIRATVGTLFNDGLAYEARIASAERKREELSLRALTATQRIWALELERETALYRARRTELETRIAKLGAGEEYIRRLLDEDLRRMELVLAVMKWRTMLNDALLSEIASFLGESGVIPPERIDAVVRAAKQGLIVGKLADELVGTDESLRWYANDLESGIDDRVRNAKEKIAELEAQKKSVAEALAEAEKKLSGLARAAGD